MNSELPKIFFIYYFIVLKIIHVANTLYNCIIATHPIEPIIQIGLHPLFKDLFIYFKHVNTLKDFTNTVQTINFLVQNRNLGH